ncbi:MAG TPA: hypothetical protein VI893_05145 [Thermoplasmata archaeon]|nr:hypothetical protein [Thermoplasmata archaeon]
MSEDRGLQGCLELLQSPTSAKLLGIHGELRLALARSRQQASDPQLLRGAVRLNERFQNFLVFLEAERTTKRHAEVASMMDLGSFGLLALQDISRKEERTIPRLLLAGVTEGLAYLATREFVKAGQAGIDGLLSRNALALQEEFWSLLEDGDHNPTPQETEKVREALVGLSAALADAKIDPGRRAALATALYAMLLRTRIETVLGPEKKRVG